MLGKGKRLPGIHKTCYGALLTMSFPAEKHISTERTLRGNPVNEAQIGKEGTPTSAVHHR